MKVTKLLSILLVLAFACTAFASCTALAEKGAPKGALTYIGLRINPEIEMVTDESGVVVSANAVNEDGEVVLSEVELEGMTAEDATVEFTETAVDLGFMDPENGKDTVYVDVNSENAEVAEKVEKTLSDKLMKFFEKKGITGKVSKEVLDSYIAAAEEWNVTPGHAKIIARVLEANPELTYEELLNLTVKELLELLKANVKDNNVTADLKKSYNDAVKALKAEYKEMFELREAIDDIEDDLEDAREEDDDDDDDKLTDEEIAALEAELAEKKAALEELEKEYKEKLDAIKAEFKVSSDKARDEHRKEAEERKQAKKEGKKFEDRDDDDDDDDRDDDDRDEKKDKNEKPENSKKPEHNESEKNEKGEKNDKDGKPEMPRHEHDDDEDEEDDD